MPPASQAQDQRERPDRSGGRRGIPHKSTAHSFFDFPGLDVGPYAEVLGGLHHVAISVEPQRCDALVARLTRAGIEHVVHSGVPVYVRDPDGARIELIADPLGEMYGEHVL